MIVKQESECKPPIDYISNAHIYLWFQKVYRASEVQLKKQTLQNHACIHINIPADHMQLFMTLPWVLKYIFMDHLGSLNILLLHILTKVGLTFNALVIAL